MKKASLVIITLTLICCSFALGFFLGHGTGRGAISISTAPTVTFPSTPIPTKPAEEALPLDINTASVEEFNSLPGIGDTLAQRIVTYREENGSFRNLADLLNVEGIGEKKLESILDYITIGGQP